MINDEAGHAVVALHSPASDPIHKATIIPRGRALGMVMRLPEGDRISMAVDKLLADLRVACGGRIAEEMINGSDGVTTGASNDIERATDIARNMVTKWGLSDKLGPLTYSEDEGEHIGAVTDAIERIVLRLPKQYQWEYKIFKNRQDRDPYQEA